MISRLSKLIDDDKNLGKDVYVVPILKMCLLKSGEIQYISKIHKAFNGQVGALVQLCRAVN